MLSNGFSIIDLWALRLTPAVQERFEAQNELLREKKVDEEVEEVEEKS